MYISKDKVLTYIQEQFLQEKSGLKQSEYIYIFFFSEYIGRVYVCIYIYMCVCIDIYTNIQIRMIIFTDEEKMFDKVKNHSLF